MSNQYPDAAMAGTGWRCCCTDMDHAEGWDDAEQHLGVEVRGVLRGPSFLGYKNPGPIHGTNGIFPKIYHKNQPNVGKYS